jgi:myo-inositol-1(or 4)-monophosphatase
MTAEVQSVRLRDVAQRAALSVRDLLLSGFRSTMEIDYKVDFHDVVTRFDRESEEAIRAFLAAEVPDSVVVGEEAGESGTGRIRWYVDPIDGTSNFASGIAFWCVSVGAIIDDEIVAGAVYDPVAGHLFSADLTGAWLGDTPIRSRSAPEESKATLITGYPVARDFRLDGREKALDRFATLAETFSTLRRPGSAALSIAHVAAGWADAAAGFGVNAWDVAAAILILTKAEGTYRPLTLGKVDTSAPAHFCPGYVATGAGGNYPTLLAVAEAISSDRNAARNRTRLAAG